jgi:cold shock CspA family protein
MPNEVRTGTIRAYKPENGFGFIRDERSGVDSIFLHCSELTGALFAPCPGMRVQFELFYGAGDKPRAKRVKLLDA